MALVVDRFDLRADGTYRGFEDFCVLNARRTEQKYHGSYETSILKRFAQFVSPASLSEDFERLFTLIALNCAVRNGDAHLKNFGVCYDDVLGDARLAPVYDVVTTTVYLAADNMALTLNGTIRWPQRKELERLGVSRGLSTPPRIRQILTRIADALSDVAPLIESYGKEHPAFEPVGRRMLEEWEKGRTMSLTKAS